MVSFSRPAGCQSAADLFMWLVQGKKILKRSNLEFWRQKYRGQVAKEIAERVIARWPSDCAQEAMSGSRSLLTDNTVPGPEDAGPAVHGAFNESHFQEVLGKIFGREELDSAIDRCLTLSSHAFKTLSRTKSKRLGERIKMLAACRPVGCSNAGDLFLWLVEEKVVKRADLQFWQAKFKGQVALDIAKRVVSRYPLLASQELSDSPEGDDSMADKGGGRGKALGDGAVAHHQDSSGRAPSLGEIRMGSEGSGDCAQALHAGVDVEDLDNDFGEISLADVLSRCFNNEGIKGLVAKCLERDESAFRPLRRTTSKTKGDRLKLLCGCRPAGCCSPGRSLSAPVLLHALISLSHTRINHFLKGKGLTSLPLSHLCPLPCVFAVFLSSDRDTGCCYGWLSRDSSPMKIWSTGATLGARLLKRSP